MSDESRPGVAVLGGINMDLVAVAPNLPRPGETVMGSRFFTTPGGKGGNQAVAAARLGARVRMVGRVGRDAFGSELLRSLQSYGVDVSGVAQDPDNSSGIAMILLDQSGQNHIVAVYGANFACNDEQVRQVAMALEDVRVLLLQLEIPLEVSLEAARLAKARGVTVILDPAPARELPPEAYQVVDIMTPNQVEASILSGISVEGASSARQAAERLLQRGVKTAIVKLGEMGIYCGVAMSGEYIPAFPVRAVDTVAAGDAFNGALGVALAQGRGLREALYWGMAAGAISVTRAGAQQSMPSREEVEALLR